MVIRYTAERGNDVMLRKLLLILIVASLKMSSFVDCVVAEEKTVALQPLALEWKDNGLTIHAPNLAE